MVRADNALDLLLPDADPEIVRRALDVTRFLRMLCDDAVRGHASVGIDLDSARKTLEHTDRDALESAHDDLLRHHLRALLPADSFACFGEPALDLRAAWRLVDDFRDDVAGLAGPAEPDESAASVAARLVASREKAADPGSTRLRRARLEHATSGARAGERAYRELLLAAGRERSPASLQRAAVAGVAECLLERGAVREARAWIGEHPLHVSGDGRLRVLFAWTRLLTEDSSGARAVLAGLRPWNGAIPAALVELRTARPEWLALLAGRSEAPPPASERRLVERGEVGASCSVVSAFRPGHTARVLGFDATPALARRREEWLRERDGATAVAGEPERQLVASARVLVEHADPGAELRGALGRDATRARAMVPVLDLDGEAAGWLHLEFEHHLVPCRARLEAFARAWRDDVLRAREGSVRTPTLVREAPPERREERCAEVFRALVHELGVKTLQRRWWGFVVDRNEPELVVEGGEGAGLAPGATGKRRALARALATESGIVFEEPDERLSIHAEAGSGVVLPLRFESVVVGLLAIESSRRRDFKGVDPESLAPRTLAAGLALHTARFQSWHRARFGFEPWYEPKSCDFGAFARRLAAAARARSPVVLKGPAGVGKLVIARWLHFESAGRSGPFKVHSCGVPARSVSWPRLARAAEGGTLVLDDVEDLEPHLQEELLRELEGVERAGEDGERALAVRVVATTRAGFDTAVGAGRMRPDLAQRLDRLRLVIPGLRERREDIPALVDALTRRFADEEELTAPRCSDEALALLWRQPWIGNVRELENLVYKLVLLHPGRELSAAAVTEVAGQFGLAQLRKLPSRHPDRRDLIAALRTTRTAGGRVNKTRAAQYLGWDPDTLVARLQEARLDDVAPAEVAAWMPLDAPGLAPLADEP